MAKSIDRSQSSRSLSRRNFIQLVGATAGATLVAGCTAVPMAQTAEQGPATARPAIRFVTDWSTGLRGDVISRALELFREQNPDIQVIYEPSVESDAVERIIIELSGGNAADVFIFAGDDFYNFWEKDAFLDLTEYVNLDDNLNADDFYPQPGAFHTEGNWYGMPFQLVTGGCFYNATLFEQAGVPGPRDWPDRPDGIWTWEDFLQAAQELTTDTDGDGEIDQWGCYFPNSFEGGYLSWIWSNGGDYIDLENMKTTLDQPAAIEAFQFVMDLVHTHKVSVEPSVRSQLATQLGVNPFMAGKVAITPQAGEWMIPLMAENGFEMHRCPYPRSPKTGQAIGPFNNQPHLVWAGTEYPQACYDLVTFLAGPEVQTLIAESGQEPSRKSVAETDAWLGDLPVSKQAWLEQIEVAYDLRFHRNWREWYTELEVVAERAMLGEVSAAEAMAQATEVGDRILSGATS
jgi:multiple sugar transport system substrate-binding protein